MLSFSPSLSNNLEAESVDDSGTNENMKNVNENCLNVDEYLADVREKRTAVYPPIGMLQCNKCFYYIAGVYLKVIEEYTK